MKNSLHQAALLNAPQSARIFPTTFGNFAVQNPYSIYTLPLCKDYDGRGLSLSNNTHDLTSSIPDRQPRVS